MTYTIKAIPTAYAGVNFRSRLEARWAAFFDLCEWKWDYEPFDLEGWAPDFLLRTVLGPVLVEVKPYDVVAKLDEELARGPSVGRISEYDKAANHGKHHQVLYLGLSPLSDGYPVGFPAIPPLNAPYPYAVMLDAITVNRPEHLWAEAGNIVQWHPSRRAAA